MRLTVWLNAFIPKNVPGSTKLIRRGLHAGKTAIELPAAGYLANPEKLLRPAPSAYPMGSPSPWIVPGMEAGYLTDQRGFDSSINASVRMQSVAQLNLLPNVSLLKTDHITSGTIEVDLDSGAQTGFANADMSKCHFEPLIMIPRPHFKSMFLPFEEKTPPVRDYFLYVEGAASDPLVRAAADIDYSGCFTINVQASPFYCDVRFQGLLDEFPAFECYAQIGSTTKRLFASMPPPGNSVVDLLGPANRKVCGSVSFSELEPCYIPGIVAPSHGTMPQFGK